MSGFRNFVFEGIKVIKILCMYVVLIFSIQLKVFLLVPSDLTN